MQDNIHPKWKIDAVEGMQSCFYETGGLCLINSDLASMYDCPGGNYEPHEERSVFCTFIIINSQITHLVKWSKQKSFLDEELVGYGDSYCAVVEAWDNKSLPFWAIKKLQTFYETIDCELPSILYNADILEQLKNKSEEELNAEATTFFLAPPEMWITLVKYPQLFNDEVSANLEQGRTSVLRF